MTSSTMKAKLYVLEGRDVGRTFAIRKRAVLGRGADCDVRLADRSVSRRHAVIDWEAGRFWIEDLGSRNGVTLGGERVSRRELADHDELALGELVVRFRVTSDDEPPAGPETPLPEPGDAEEILIEDTTDEVMERALAATRIAPASEARPAPTSRDARRVALLRARSGGAFLGGDLAQRPIWVRLCLFLLVLAVAAGLFWASFLGVQLLRGSP